jgi:hypothetical protein
MDRGLIVRAQFAQQRPCSRYGAQTTLRVYRFWRQKGKPMTLNEARELARSRPIFGSVAWLEAKELLALAPLAEQNFRLATLLLKQLAEEEITTDYLSEVYGTEKEELYRLTAKPPGLLNLRELRELAEAFEEEEEDEDGD